MPPCVVPTLGLRLKFPELLSNTLFFRRCLWGLLSSVNLPLPCGQITVVLFYKGQRKYRRNKEIDFVCLRPDGCFESSSTVGIACRTASKKLPGLEGFHFHQLRHTFTSNLLSNGAAPKDVQELLGHADVSTTMNIYAHSTREAKRSSARLLDKVVGGD